MKDPLFSFINFAINSTFSSSLALLSDSLVIASFINSVTNISDCGGQDGKILEYGFDNDFNSNLDDVEILSTSYYCDTLSKEDTIQQLNIDSTGDGYSSGNLSATGGGGEDFSGTYLISTGIDSISINNGGSGYDSSDSLTIVCVQCDGENANASISSVDSSGSITSITVDDAGSGYTADDTIFISITLHPIDLKNSMSFITNVVDKV